MLASVVLVLVALGSPAWGFSSGAPSATCKTMKPEHGVPPKTTTMPYQVAVNKNKVAKGEDVEIVVSGATPFKGIQVQVRNSANAASGKFLIPDSDRFAKPLDCEGGKSNAATHKNTFGKKQLKLKWKAPATAGEYKVYVTVVQEAEVFWVAQPTQTIIVN